MITVHAATVTSLDDSRRRRSDAGMNTLLMG